MQVLNMLILISFIKPCRDYKALDKLKQKHSSMAC